MGVPLRCVGDEMSEARLLSPGDLTALRGAGTLGPEGADRMIENAVGTLALPLGVGLNLVVNGREYVVPMAVEELF